LKGYKWLAWLPFIGILVGVFWANRVTPYVFGLPFLLFWCVLWVILTSIFMAIIFNKDPENKESDEA
jgi:hypothetical protein